MWPYFCIWIRNISITKPLGPTPITVLLSGFTKLRCKEKSVD